MTTILLDWIGEEYQQFIPGARPLAWKLDNSIFLWHRKQYESDNLSEINELNAQGRSCAHFIGTQRANLSVKAVGKSHRAVWDDPAPIYSQDNDITNYPQSISSEREMDRDHLNGAEISQAEGIAKWPSAFTTKAMVKHHEPKGDSAKVMRDGQYLYVVAFGTFRLLGVEEKNSKDSYFSRN